jgi:transcriptional regulator with AAA-type ATPase domain
LSGITELETIADLDAARQTDRPIADSYLSNSKNPFDQIIGHQSSLKQVISQAKAAVYYPPSGLHMLLLGKLELGRPSLPKKPMNIHAMKVS